MSASFRLLPLVAGLALLAGCQGRTDADNLADLDAKLTNGVANGDQDAANQAIALAQAGGRIDKAPAAIATKNVAPAGQTLGSLARDQAAGKGGGAAQSGACAKNVKTGPEWADRMPQAFRLYPGAKLLEAAGLDQERCTLRIISFTSTTGIDPILNYYYTLAHRAGYDAEHLLSGSEHQLGGTHGEAAYVVFARAKDGVTEVDIIAN